MLHTYFFVSEISVCFHHFSISQSTLNHYYFRNVYIDERFITNVQVSVVHVYSKLQNS